MKNLISDLCWKILNKISSFYWLVTYSRFRKTYDIDANFRFNGKSILFYGKGRINAGAGSYIGELSTLQAADGFSINIGIGCKLSHNVRVYTQSDIADYNFSMGDPPQKYGSVTFGDFCWVGANVFINPNVTIGENAIVGANSVVTKNIPPFEIWGGVPARLIRRKKIS
jgi:maltose O-acetyltransferase